MPGYSKERTLLNPDYRDILRIFSEENVEYVLVGAYALAVYGYPRATGDIDLWVHPSKDNAVRVLKALSRFGAPMTGVDASDFEQPGIVFQIGLAPNRIDLLTEVSGIPEFREAWDSRLEVDLEGVRLLVMSRPLMIRNKRATGRPKDIADLAWLESEE